MHASICGKSSRVETRVRGAASEGDEMRTDAEGLRTRVVALGTATVMRDDAAREVANLRASTSWRLMAPARMIAARLWSNSLGD